MSTYMLRHQTSLPSSQHRHETTPSKHWASHSGHTTWPAVTPMLGLVSPFMPLFGPQMLFCVFCECCINAAYYFSSFGNVNRDNMSFVNGSLGTEPSCVWKPWLYTERVKLSSQVSNKKEELSKPRNGKPAYALSTQRSKLLDFMRETKCRQEYPPLLGPLVDSAYAEPLHNTNNSWQYIHSHIFDLALQKSGIDPACTEFKSLSSASPFKQYCMALRDTAKTKRLYVGNNPL